MNDVITQYENLWDNNAKDVNELKTYLRKELSFQASGYANGHEWFAICGITKEKFTDVVRALKDANNNKLHSYDISIDVTDNELICLQCNTAKDPQHKLMDFIIKQCNLSNVTTYYQDCWDYPEVVELNPLDCQLIELNVLFDGWNEDTEYTQECWNVSYDIKDNRAGVTFGMGGGALSPEQALNILDTVKTIPKAETFKDVSELHDYQSILEEAYADDLCR